ncbi:MAG: T9SS type A sorting domain-containing protein [Rhodothermaceae bacterium]|nr:T9SS type A sorting domain-containing protein [Rhodothermaceae bacterium]
MNILLRLYILSLGISIIFTGPAMAQKALKGIYVINEGAFLQGNASVTGYDAGSATVTQNAFFAKNGRPLGDVANSASIIDDYLYIVVNNSHAVEVVDKNDLRSVARIEIDDTNGGSPRHLLQVDENRAFVTNLFDNSISVIDLTTNTVTNTFAVTGFPEGLVMAAGKVFVAQSGLGGGNSVAVVDPVAMELTNTIEVGDNPQVIRVHSNGSVWVLCTGDYGFDESFNYDPDRETFGEIHIIDPAEETTIRIIEIGGHPTDMKFHGPTGTLYVLNNGIQVVNTETFEAGDEKLINRFLNSFSIIDTDEPMLIGGIAPDFSSGGRAVMFSMEGVAADSFATGIGPRDFVMMYTESPVSVRDDQELPAALSLGQNYPNPFNPTTVIPFELEAASMVRLSVFDVTGGRIAIVADGNYAAGSHTAVFNASDLASGVYIIRLEAGGNVAVGKMMLVR